MTGYFFISSISNVTNIVRANDSCKETTEGFACKLFKKIFRYDATAEELEEFKTKECKKVKLAKGIPLLDYLIPSDACLPKLGLQVKTISPNYEDSKWLIFGSHSKIQVPPPRAMV